MIVTMKDIAKEAGVSQAAVSLVLNGKGSNLRLSAKTREHILLVSKRLGYTRNALATAIKTGKSNIIALICLLQNRHVTDILRGFNEALLQKGFLNKLMNIDLETEAEMENIVRSCIEQRVAGVACISIKPQHLKIIRPRLEQAEIPLIGIDIYSKQDNMVMVSSGDEEGMALLVRHLIRQGHRKIGYLGVYDPWNPKRELDSSRIRRKGYCKAMHEADLRVTKDAVRLMCPMEKYPEEEEQKLNQFFEKYQPTAIVGSSDYVAMRVLQWAYRHHIRVPDDLSVCGFAGLYESVFTVPPLTTVRQPFFEMGMSAGEKIMALSEHKKCESQIFPDELIIRDSDALPSKMNQEIYKKNFQILHYKNKQI